MNMEAFEEDQYCTESRYSFNEPEYILYDNDDQEDSLLIRLIFAYSHVHYETRSIQDDGMDFYGFPFDCVPQLELNGLRLSNINTICRHLSWRYDLSGCNASEDSIVDVIGDAVNDARMKLSKWIRIVQYRDWNDYDMDSLEETARRYIVNYIGPAFEEMIKRNGGEWVIGDRLTWADLAISSLFNSIIFHRPSFFDNLPLLYNHCRRIADIDSLQGMLYNIRERSFKKSSSCPSSYSHNLPSFTKRSNNHFVLF